MTSRRTGFLAAIVLLLIALLGAAIWLVLGADETATDGPDAPDVAAANATPQRPPRPATDSTRTPREHVVATPDDDAAREPSTGTTPLPEPTHSPVAPQRTMKVTVVNEGGVPVRDARVAAFAAFGEIRYEPTDATTDIEGHATLVVTGMAAFYVRAWTLDAAAIGERVTVDPDATVEITLTLEPALVVAGRVVSDSSMPIHGADVMMRPYTTDPFGHVIGVKTDADGRFELGSLPTRMLEHSTTRISARAHGYARLDVRAPELRSTWDNVLLQLEQGQIVRGRCVTTGAAPVSGVRVSAGGTTPLQTTRDGTFEIVGLSREGGIVDIMPPEHVVPPPIVIAPGAGEIDLGDILLATGRPIDGVVVDDQEHPVTNAVVRAFEQEREREVRSTSTDGRGRFTLPHIGEGPHTIVATSTEGGEWSSRVSGRVTDVTAGTSGVRIVLSGGLTLLVEFKRESDREPVEVASAEVEVTRVDVETGRTVSAWAGPGMTSVRVTFEQAGRYLVVVKVPGYESATLEDIEILEDRPTRIEALFRAAPE